MLLACRGGHHAVVRVLLEEGRADVNAVDAVGSGGLALAVRAIVTTQDGHDSYSCFVEVVRVLLRAGIAAPRSILGGAAGAGAAGSFEGIAAELQRLSG